MEKASMQTSGTDLVDVSRLRDHVGRLQPWPDAKNMNPAAFQDIYGLLPKLCDPETHTRLDGRRGTGKTALMVNGYLSLQTRFVTKREHPPYRGVPIYIDLHRDLDRSYEANPALRAMDLYRKIMRLVLQDPEEAIARQSRRFWGLKDFLDERPNHLRRFWAGWQARKYRAYVKSDGEAMRVGPGWIKDRDEISAGIDVGIEPFGPAGGPVGLFRAGRVRIRREKGKEVDRQAVFGLSPRVVRRRLIDLLDAIEIERLILFLDEWSAVSIGEAAQPYLYDMLMKTIDDGDQVVLKLATIPGHTKLPDRGFVYKSNFFSLDDEITGDWSRQLFHILIRHLAAVSGDDFPEQTYLTKAEKDSGFPTFIRQVFGDQDTADELVRASENLPRQMMRLFMEACHFKLHGRVSLGTIRRAAVADFEHNWRSICEGLQSQMASERDLYSKMHAIVPLLLQAGSRTVDLERVERLLDAVGWLAAEGIIHPCKRGGLEGFSRYYLGYPAEIYRLVATRKECHDLDWLGALEPDQRDCVEIDEPPRVELARTAADLYRASRSVM